MGTNQTNFMTLWWRFGFTSQLHSCYSCLGKTEPPNCQFQHIFKYDWDPVCIIMCSFKTLLWSVHFQVNFGIWPQTAYYRRPWPHINKFLYLLIGFPTILKSDVYKYMSFLDVNIFKSFTAIIAGTSLWCVWFHESWGLNSLWIIHHTLQTQDFSSLCRYHFNCGLK